MSTRSPFDLTQLFTRKSEKQTPQIVGVVTMKGESFDAVKTQIADAGFKTDDMIELPDESVVFKQVDAVDSGEDGVVVRLSDSVGVVTKGFRPYNMDMDIGDTSFKDMAAAQGFYPSVSTVLDVVRGSIYGVVEKAANPDDAAVAVAKMFDEAKQYATSMVKGLPAKAFKLEADDTAVEEPFDIESLETIYKGMSPEHQAKMKAKMKAMSGDEPAKKEDAPSTTDDKAPVAKSEGAALTVEDVSKLITEALTASSAALITKMEALVSGVNEGVKKSVGELTEQVKKADEKAQSVSDTLSGMTVRGSEGGDIVLTSTRKAESSGGGREIDTAFIPRNQRAGRRQ